MVPGLQDDTLIDAIQYVDFDRETPALDQAMLSAVTDLARIDGWTWRGPRMLALSPWPTSPPASGAPEKGVRLLQECETE